LGESAVFIHNAVRGIMTKFGIADVSILSLDRYRLRDEIEIKIQQHRMAERRNAFQRYLLPDSPLTVSEGRALNFSTISYDPSFYYDGSYKFKKHYFPPKPGELQRVDP